MSNVFDVQVGSWSQLKCYAMQIREQVFILEQQISPEDEWDMEDETSIHFVVFHEGEAIATARLLQNHSIGRVAVIKAYRGKGVGFELMKFIIEFAQREKRPTLNLSAQVHALPFYQRLGFEPHGKEYLDCGIPHVYMTMQLE